MNVDITKSDRLSPRHARRLRLAKMLTDGQFDAALEEASRAWQQGEILEDDVRFVQDIAVAAKRRTPPPQRA